MGVSIIATDKNISEPLFIDIKKKTAEDAVKNYKNANILFMCWPPYQNKADLKAMENFNGELIIIVGEFKGGCTGSIQGAEYLEENFYLEATEEIKNLKDFTHDILQIWRKKNYQQQNLDAISSMFQKAQIQYLINQQKRKK